jgi:2'-5' RNA ligase
LSTHCAPHPLCYKAAEGPIAKEFISVIASPFPRAAGTARQAARLQGQCLRGRFTLTDNFHLTLAFLGETERRAAAEAAMDRVSAPGFVLQIGAPGLFRQRDGDLWWLGIEPSPALLEVHRQLTEELSAAGFVLGTPPLPPSSHLGRQVGPAPVFDRAAFARSLPPMGTKVRRITLMQSEHIQGRLTYTPLHHRALSSG